VTGAVAFSINGRRVLVPAEDADLPLVDYLHEEARLTGTKFGCGIGVCHACTVAVRPQPGAPLQKLLSCSTPISALQGSAVYTVEALSTDALLHPLQSAFLEHFAFQCGYCTPGFLMSAFVLLDHLQRGSVTRAELDEQIERWVGDNICRCSGYVRYIEAIRDVASGYVQG